MLLPGVAARATIFTWSGGFPFSVNDDWTTANNWVGQNVPVSATNTDLVFDATTSGGTGRTTSNNNIADPFTLRSLTFASGAPLYTLTGGALNVGSSGIAQNSANVQTINNSVTLGVSQTWTFAGGAGALNLGNDLVVSATGAGPTLTLSSGTVNLISSGNAFYLGANAGETGSLNLSGTAAVSAQTTYVGLDGTGTVTQTGGSFNTNTKTLQLAFRIGSTGNYNLSGANSTLTTSTTNVGFRGTGTFTQSGGTHTTGLLSVAPVFANANSQGTYNLNGGTLRTGSVATGTPGSTGTSTFNFNGGTLEATGNSATFFQGLTTTNVRNGGAIVYTNTFTVTIAQPLVHSTVSGDSATDGGLTKTGSGTLNLTGANTYTGATTVSGGTLRVNNTTGSGTGTGSVAVNNTGTLGGSGTIAGSVTVTTGGTLAPGNSPGRLTLGSLTLASGANTAIELGGTVAGSGYDQVLVGGPLTLGGTLTVTLVSGFTLSTVGQKFFILDNTSANPAVLTTGVFANAPATLVVGTNLFAVNYADTDPANGNGLANDVSLTYLGVVPEPSTWAMMIGGGAVLLLLVARRRRLA